MKNDFKLLYQNFLKIKNMGWLQVPKLGYGENGLFFEELLGLERNSNPLPDYNSIELKVQNIKFKYPITLFSLNFNGPTDYELQRIVKAFGAHDETFINQKVLYIKLNTAIFENWGKNLKMKLDISSNLDKLYLRISHSNGKIIERKSYWYIESIYKSLKQKAQFLCIVENEIKFINNQKYVKYNNLHFFELLSFDVFLENLLNGIISVKIKYGVYKKGPNIGKPYNHGISFQIYYNDIIKIYKPIFVQKK